MIYTTLLDFFGIIYVIAVLLAIAAVLVLRFSVNAGAAPFFSVCLTVTFITAASLLGKGRIATILILIFGAAAVLYSGYLLYKKRDLQPFLNLGFITFICLSVGISLLFCIRRPMFSLWDEFSFWGTAAKIMSNTGHLVTVTPNNLVGVTTPPALLNLSYLFNFLGEFGAHKMYIGYNVMYFSIIAAAVGAFPKKMWHIAVSVLLFAYVCPYIVMNYVGRAVFVVPAYMTSYSDIPIGQLLAGILIVYMCYPVHKMQTTILCSAALAMLTLSKDMGFAFSLVAAGIITADLLIVERQYKIFHRIVASVILFATPIAAFAAWTFHLSSAAGINRGELGGEAQLSMVQMLVRGTAQLFGSNKSDKFIKVFGNLKSAFLNTKVAMIGSGFFVFFIITIIFSIIFLITRDNKLRLRATLLYLLTSFGYLIYNIFLGFTYVYIFKGTDGENLVSYERYASSYCLAWMLITFVFAGFILSKDVRYKRLVRLCIVGGGVLAFCAVNYFVVPEYTHIGYPNSYFTEQKEIESKVNKVKGMLSSEHSKIFYINSQDNGIGWFQNYYYFLPTELDYSGGGDIFRFEDKLYDYLLSNDIEYVYVDLADDSTVFLFGRLFSDNLEEYFKNDKSLYNVAIDRENSTMSLVPIG